MTVVETLALARSHGVEVRLKADGSGLRFEADAEPPPDVVTRLMAARPGLLRILTGREAAQAALASGPPTDCPDERWAEAQRGLQHFIADGWGDRAALLGWTADELYRVPPCWRRIDLTGAALLIGQSRVIAVTEASIVIETLTGSRLKFRRIGREHLA